VTSFALGNTGSVWADSVFVLRSDVEPMDSVGNGFCDLKTGVKAFLVGRGGHLDVLESCS
jgi:hypothetical protein